MQLTLSWDLFVIVFFAVVITYSFIIGKHESVKIIISTYIAIVAAQGMGNLIERLSTESQPLFSMVGLTLDIQLLATTKLILFILTIIFLAVRGGFEIDYQKCMYCGLCTAPCPTYAIWHTHEYENASYTRDPHIIDWTLPEYQVTNPNAKPMKKAPPKPAAKTAAVAQPAALRLEMRTVSAQRTALPNP